MAYDSISVPIHFGFRSRIISWISAVTSLTLLQQKLLGGRVELLQEVHVVLEVAQTPIGECFGDFILDILH